MDLKKIAIAVLVLIVLTTGGCWGYKMYLNHVINQNNALNKDKADLQLALEENKVMRDAERSLISLLTAKNDTIAQKIAQIEKQKKTRKVQNK